MTVNLLPGQSITPAYNARWEIADARSRTGKEITVHARFEPDAAKLWQVVPVHDAN
jgi:hypothetical protein